MQDPGKRSGPDQTVYPEIHTDESTASSGVFTDADVEE